MATLVDAPPLNDRGMVDLISPSRAGTIILTPDQHAYSPATGAERLVQKGRVIKLRDGRASISLEDYELLLEHPAWTGTTEPKLIWLSADRQLVHMEDGVRVVDGAQSSTGGRLAPPPIRGWDDLAYTRIRAAVKDGLVRDLVGALLYESQHKNREGVVRLLGAAIAQKELPTATTMRAIDRRAAGPQGDPEDEDEGGLGGDPVEVEDAELAPAARSELLASDDDIRAQIAAVMAEAEGGTDIGDGEDEPLPEGVA